MANQRKTRSDTVAGQVKQHQDQDVVIGVPDGVIFDTDEEMVIWRQFTAARAVDMWREFDLILVSKMVKLESQSRRHSRVIEQTGPIIENKRGTPIENPLLRVVDVLERRQLAIIRSLSLGVSADTAKNMNKAGRSAADVEDLKKLHRGDVVSLLAT